MSSPLDRLLGKWALKESDNFDEYLKALGVGFMWRQMAKTSKPAQEWTQTGNQYLLKTISALKTHETGPFEVGKEFDETRIDGEVCKTTVEIDGEKVKHTMRMKDGKTSVLFREVGADGVYTLTLTCGDVTATRKYHKDA